MENYSDRKRLGRIPRNFNVSAKMLYIVHGWWPFSFARRTIVLLLQANDKSAWRVMFGSPWHVRSANFAWAKRFCYVEAPKSAVDVSFQQISWFFKCTNSMVQTLSALQLFHNLWIELRFCIQQAIHTRIDGKLFRSKTIRSNREQFQLFRKNCRHCSRLMTFQFCPAHHSITLINER